MIKIQIKSNSNLVKKGKKSISKFKDFKMISQLTTGQVTIVY